MCRKSINWACFVLVLCLVQTGIGQVEPGLVGWWKLDEASGIIAADSSGQGKIGTVEGEPTWLPAGGMVDGALEFDGADDQVTVYDAGDFGITNTMSIAVWMEIASIPRDFEYVWGYDTYPTVRLMGASTGTTTYRFIYRVGAPDIQVNLGDAGWHHVVCIADGTNCLVYVDGALASQGAQLGDIETHTNWRIGNAYGDASRRFTGKLDDVRVYNRALSSTEVKILVDPISAAKSSEPIPNDGATDVPPNDTVLSWTPGPYALTHDVYFGTSFDDVSSATATADPGGVYMGRQDLNTYATPRLELGQTYYWRVDEVSGPPDDRVYEGDIWQFTVEPVAYAIPGMSIIATASSSNSPDEGPENTVNGSGLDADDLHSVASTAMWLTSDADTNAAWIQYEFDKVYKLHEMWVWNHNTTTEHVLGFGIKDATMTYSVDGANWATFDTTHEFARGPSAAGYAHNTTVDLNGVAAKYVKITANNNWGGILNQCGLSEVRFFYHPVWAREPNPDSGATNVSIGTIDGPLDVTLSFRTGREAAIHNVYLSTDEQAVIDGTAGATAVTENSYGPLPLDLGTTYYWRVDEVDDDEIPTTWQGEVWNFTTQTFFVVDDFEDYNDYLPDRIFDAWVDGWDIPTNGSIVGHSDPDFANGEHIAETVIVHNGKQSMPFFYDNSVGYSEATRSLTTGRDWTTRGAGVLSLWFMGDPANAAERMYVALNGSPVYNDNPNIAQINTWTEWTIDLKAFADQGVDLTNVTTIMLGFGDKNNPSTGGSGVVYFDDVRLTKAAVPIADPSLVGWWKLDESSGTIAADSSGQGKDGTVEGNPTWLPAGGMVDGALEFDGADDQVTVYDAGDFGITNTMSVSVWMEIVDAPRAFEYVWGYDSYPTVRLMGAGAGSTTFRFIYRADAPDIQANLGTAGWHHVVCVADGTTCFVYVDGTLANQGAQMGGDIETHTNWRIGNAYGNETRRFTGKLDDVRVYNRALPGEEILQLAGN